MNSFRNLVGPKPRKIHNLSARRTTTRRTRRRRKECMQGAGARQARNLTERQSERANKTPAAADSRAAPAPPSSEKVGPPARAQPERDEAGVDDERVGRVAATQPRLASPGFIAGAATTPPRGLAHALLGAVQCGDARLPVGAGLRLRTARSSDGRWRCDPGRPSPIRVARARSPGGLGSPRLAWLLVSAVCLSLRYRLAATSAARLGWLFAAAANRAGSL